MVRSLNQYLKAEFLTPYFVIPAGLTIRFGGMTIKVVRFTKINSNIPWDIGAHAHENFEFHYIFDGKGVVDIEKNQIHVQKNNFYITGPFIKHGQHTDEHDPMKEYCIECKIDFEEDRDNQETARFESISKIPDYECYEDSGTILEKLQLIEELGKNETFGVLSQIQLLTAQVVLLSLQGKYQKYFLLPHKVKQDMSKQRVTAIKNYIDANISENITLKDVAQKFFFSEKQINRMIIAEYKCTFHQYVSRIRLEMAVNLLKDTIIPIEDVATEAGFTSYRQMLRVFDKNNLEKPSDIRKNA